MTSLDPTPSSGHVPRLRHRPLHLRDLPECMSLLPAYLQFDAGEKTSIAALWERLVYEPGMITGVMEDIAAPAGQRIQGWGVTVALPPPWVERLALEREPRAHPSRRIYQALLDGSLALPGDREFGRLNASGELVLLILHFTMRRNDPYDPYAHRLIACANDCFRAFHDGYQMRAIYYENSVSHEPIAVHSGFRTRNFVDEADLQHLPPEQRPALYALTLAEARASIPGTPARNCFEHQPPRFRFSPAQRRLLWFALFDESDDALMTLLDVSVHGLKKLWRGIYERIEDAAPDFFGEDAGADDGKRGPEKRRQVLAYVRQRPEELRPWV
jgi:hypothetical protein